MWSSIHVVEQMPELVLLRLQVVLIVLVGRNLDRHAFDDAQAVTVEADDLTRVVREKANVADAQVDKDLRPDTVMTQVGCEAERQNLNSAPRRPIMGGITELMYPNCREVPTAPY